MSGRATPGVPEITLSPGPQTLNGDQALVYLQGKDLPDDAERAKRQQGFLYAMYRQALGPSNLLANPSTLNVVVENTETNMSGVQMVQLAGRVKALKDSGVPIEVNKVPGGE
jgi:anionic cell wall polymer biosynthesis LytR-Cps2A-Psr (LCP) family protein